MKASKRRPVANAQSQVHSFNKSAHPETIADHNDPYRIDWTVVDDDAEYYVGEKVSLRYEDSYPLYQFIIARIFIKSFNITGTSTS